MATDIDLNLDSVTLPNVSGTVVVDGYGKKTASETTFLTAQQVINNLQEPYLYTRAIIPSRDNNYVIKNVFHDAKIVFSTPVQNFTVNLPVGKDQGHLLHIVNDSSFTLTFAVVTTGLTDSDKVVLAGTATTLYQTSLGWRRISAGSLEHAVGTLPVSHGGTGATSFASGELLVGNGSNAFGTRSITGTINDSSSIPTASAVLSHVATAKSEAISSAASDAESRASSALSSANEYTIEKAIAYIDRNGTTFTARNSYGTFLFNFDQQDTRTVVYVSGSTLYINGPES